MGQGRDSPSATFLTSSLQIKATICLELPGGSECWAWEGQGRHRGQLKPCGPAPVPWLKRVLVDAEMRHPSREALEPSRGQQEGQNTMASERGTCLQSKEHQRGAGEQQELSSLCPQPVVCPVPPVLGLLLQEGFQPQIVGGHKQLQGKDSKLQTPDKTSLIPVEVFLLCCCTVLIKACLFRHYDLKNPKHG